MDLDDSLEPIEEEEAQDQSVIATSDGDDESEDDDDDGPAGSADGSGEAEFISMDDFLDALLVSFHEKSFIIIFIKISLFI